LIFYNFNFFYKTEGSKLVKKECGQTFEDGGSVSIVDFRGSAVLHVSAQPKLKYHFFLLFCDDGYGCPDFIIIDI
jgi:hypothetical protein